MSSPATTIARRWKAKLARERGVRARTEAEAKLSEEEREKNKRNAQNKTLLQRWAADPSLYALNRFGVTLTREQVSILLSVGFGSKDLTAVKAGQKTGKTECGAICVYWLAECHGYVRASLMSSTGQNLSEILWSALRRLWVLSQKAEHPLTCDAPPLDPQTGFLVEGCRVVGLVAAKVETIGGYSGAKQFFLVDEGSSEAFDMMWPAIEGNRSGGGKVLLLGNPLRTAGEFYAIWRNPAHRQMWNVFTLSGVDASKYGIPGMADPEVVKQRLAVWGAEHPLYKQRVLGIFPDGGANAIVSLSAWDAATQRFEKLTVGQSEKFATQPLEFGVDVAWQGDDDSVVFPRRGDLFLDPVVVHGQDPVQIGVKVVEIADALAKPGEVVKIKIDTVGIGGGTYGYVKKVADEREKDRKAGRSLVWLSPVAVNVGERPTSKPSSESPGFVKLRDQLAFGASEALKEWAIVRPNMKLEEELLAATYSYDAQGRQKAEGKDEVKKRLKRSPDLADAFALAVYQGPPAVPYSNVVVNKPAPPWGSSSGSGGDWGSSPIGI